MKEIMTLTVLVALCLVVAALPGSAAPDDARSRVAAILAKVKPYDVASRDAAEEELAAGGAPLIPAIREAMEKAEETQREALDSALVRITWRGDPRNKVAAWMAEKAGQEAGKRLPQPRHVGSAALDALFPDTLFYAVIARQYPVNVMLPTPFAAQNVLVYQKDGTVKLITKPAELQALFMKAVGPIQTQGEGKKVAAAWLRLTQEFSQDGFFRFTVPEEQITTAWQPAGALVVTGKALVVPKGGDKGEITATLIFAGQGNNPRRLVQITEKRDVQAGVRPICQATKLLDADPIVRRMAEQDLLVMGRAAWPYVSEQREKASPELRREIDRVWKRVLEERR